MNIPRELERFLRQQLFRERGEKISAIELRHAASGSKGNIVDDFEFDSVNTDNLNTFVDDVINRAQNDADGMGGTHRYELHIVCEKKVTARFAFRLRSDDESVDESSGEESATSKGLLTQLMRHSEQQQRTMVSGIGAMVQMMHRTMERQETTIEKLLEERERDRDRIEAARGGEHQRELELMDAHRKGEREDMLFQKINTLFPIILNKISGREMMPTEDKNLLAGLVDTLNEDQFNKILSALKPEQQILLLTIIKEMKQKTLATGQS